MKKIFYLAVLITAVFTSCQKDTLNQEEPSKTENQYTVKSLEASDDMLSFSSMEELNKVVISLLDAGSTKRALWYSQHPNFTSLNQLYDDANGEFETADNLGIQDLNIIEEIKNKYTPYLLFNNNPEDGEEYCPIIPSELYGKPLVCNKNGDVLVNGEILNFNNITSVEETSYYKNTRLKQTKGISESSNNLHIVRGRKKMYASSSRDGYNNVYIHLTAKKQWNNWSKWRVYTTTFYVKPIHDDTYRWSDGWVLSNEIGYAMHSGATLDYSAGEMSLYVGRGTGLTGKLLIGSDGTRSKGLGDGTLTIQL